jgi:radical SAM superfamily enzyme YgiQ (UPF0313 family)
LRDEELVDLIAESGGRWIFIGMESIDPANLADVNKNFNKPGEYAAVLHRLAKRDIYAITSFIFGMDNDTPGVADRTLDAISQWPPVLPVFGQLTAFPGTPLYARLGAAGRMTRPRHWMDFAPFKMAHTPLKMTIEQAQDEVDKAWRTSYSAEANQHALEAIADRRIDYRLMHLISRLFFRGIYFPQLTKMDWTVLVVQNRRPVLKLAKEAVSLYRNSRKKRVRVQALSS